MQEGSSRSMFSLKEKLKHGENVYGPFWRTSACALVEILGNVGFDFFVIDMEHGPHSVETVGMLIRVANMSRVAPIVRVPENTKSAISRALDRGATGILVPHVSTKAETQKVVSASKFFPNGERGMDIHGRPANYGMVSKEQYLSEANQNTLVAIQIENLQGVKGLKDILEVKGIDVIFIGPYDLSQSMGIPGQVSHPELISEMEKMVKLIRGAGTVAGIYVDDPQTAKRWTDLGVQFISILIDVLIFYQGCKSLLEKLKENR